VVAVLLVLSAAGSTAAAGQTTAAVIAPPPSKKQVYLEHKQPAHAAGQAPNAAEQERWNHHLQRLIGRAPDGIINVYNGWTHETLAVVAGKDAGEGDQIPKPIIDRFFRCRWTNQSTDMDPRLFPALVAAANHFHVGRVFVISGFRSPKFNLMLQKKGHQVGRESKHTLGQAVDFRLPGVPTARLHKWAVSLALGGVGFYPKSQMIHMDSARVRYWKGD